jgi:hypothetical protein
MPRAIVGLGQDKPATNQVDILFWCRDAASGFLLEGVQHVNRLWESNRINSSVRISVVIVHDFENSCSAEATERFGAQVLPTALGYIKRATDNAADLGWKRPNDLPARTDPEEFLQAIHRTSM